MIKNTKYLEIEKYYIYFGKDLGYVGRLIEITKKKLKVKFMKRLPDNCYDWPSKDQIEEVDPEQLVSGPLNLRGCLPFHIRGVDKTIKDFESFKHERL